MSMRGSVRRARPRQTIDLRAFGWDRAATATLRHSTMPWNEPLDATPLAECTDLGARDRLSLVAQFAAHQALLQFAGVSDGDCDPAEWAVVRKRGVDCRLLRVRGRSGIDDPQPALTLIQQFAEAVGASPLETLRQSWGRAESVYQEIDARLRKDAAADLRWMRAAAAGEVLAPGAEALRSLLVASSARHVADETIVESLQAAADNVVILGDDASPLQRYSALAPLNVAPALSRRAPHGEAAPRERSESEIAEEILQRERTIFVVRNRERFDAASVRVLEMLAATAAGVWITVDRANADLPLARPFVVSPYLAAARELAGRDRAWIADFVHSDAFARFLDRGEIPPDAVQLSLDNLREPQRSYLAALALLGPDAPRELAAAFLRELSFDAVLDDSMLALRDEATCEAARSLLPAASRPALCRIAAVCAETTGDLLRAARLRVDAGDSAEAARLFEQVTFESAEEAVRVLRDVPALTPALKRTLADALLDCGRYRDAREFADELTLARIERRTGDYAAALARLERLDRSADAELLRAELLFLTGRYDDVRGALARCPTDERTQYLAAILANEVEEESDIELPPGYLAERLAFYRAVSRGDHNAAAGHATKSLDLARTKADRIDAALDRMFILFTAGRWAEARDQALRTLAEVEETQGDRAAGGVLFVLAYLAADDAQWTHASQRIHRLRQFYRDTSDDRRLQEIDLLVAHLEFSRGRFDDASRYANALLTAPLSAQMREAAALIADDIDWIEHRPTPLRSTGTSGNVELTRRHESLRARRERRAVEISGPTERAEKLMRFRDALGRGDRALAEALAAELKIELTARSADTQSLELRVLREAATRPFPFAPRDFAPLAWRFATRNRLGHWQELGSQTPLAAPDLDAILAGGASDWISVSERELLFVDGLSRWSSDSRDALASIFRTRSEHHRLRRVVEQEESTRELKLEPVDGIIGESPAMREVFALIPRVARRDVPVCVLGESGTGKELVARAMHRQSSRRGKPFTAVNCAALPENLIESELFGHVRGAFTGADRDRAGLIESSDGGTLFLDEIGEMPLTAQAKLLRFLQDGEFRRVGDSVNRTADVRIVSATNRKLEAAVEEGRFREDLYYRIGGIEVPLPPLRDRAGDVLILARHFLAGERAKHRGGASKFTAEAEEVLASYRWPGNVRELQNTIRAAHALAGDASAIDLDHLPARLRTVAVVRNAAGSYQDAVVRFRRDLIEKSLLQANGNQNRAASMLKMSRQALAYQIRELGILVRPRGAVTER
jgi:two-component system NtrC family response regulator